jgi:hypothetical protein
MIGLSFEPRLNEYLKIRWKNKKTLAKNSTRVIDLNATV